MVLQPFLFHSLLSETISGGEEDLDASQYPGSTLDESHETREIYDVQQ